MSEKKLYRILELCLWILNPLLIVLAIYSPRIQPWLFLQWIGKFHPLLLHFPIVFGILISIYFLFFSNRRFSASGEKLALAINALFAVAVAICGVLLSTENAYDSEIISLHKWGGIAISLFSWLFLYILNLKASFRKFISLVFFVVLSVATHKGAQLTHGVNALSFPEEKKSLAEKDISDTTATIYELAIAPILEQKCVSCHGDDKTKGKLKLNSPENISKGGEDGNILKEDSGKKALLYELIHLPEADEKHMPPEGKLQLTSEEKIILSKWIKTDDPFKVKLHQLAKDDSLVALVYTQKSQARPNKKMLTDLPDLAEFNSNYCSVNYLYAGTDEVDVNFFQASFYNRENLKKLEKIKDNIISLNMQGMPLGKEDLALILQFKNLQRLNLNSTNLEFSALNDLKSLPNLKELSICGIEFNEAALDKFLDQAKFTSLNVWTHTSGENQFEKIISKYPGVKITVGDNLENEVMKISNPAIDQDSSIISGHLDVKLKHLLKGVIIRYTTDGTKPDSLKSLVYSKPLRLTDNTILKIKAYKDGWISSDVVQRAFYKSEIHPDTIFLLKNPDPKYKADGAKTLIDYELGENNISNGKWLAYRESDMEFVIGFKEIQTLNSAHFNAFVDLGAHIFPINSIAVLGSNDGEKYRNIASTRFPQVAKNEPRGANTYSCNFAKPASYKYYKFVVSNLKKMPEWHAAKGKPAWIFIDELFLN